MEQPPSFQQSTQPLFPWLSPQRPSTMKKHIVPCREGCRLSQPCDTAGTAKAILSHLCLLQEREELLYFSYVSIYVKALASQLTVTPKHLVNHLHRNPQTKLGITGTPRSPCSSSFQGIPAKCQSITHWDTSTALQHIQEAAEL